VPPSVPAWAWLRPHSRCPDFRAVSIDPSEVHPWHRGPGTGSRCLAKRVTFLDPPRTPWKFLGLHGTAWDCTLSPPKTAAPACSDLGLLCADPPLLRREPSGSATRTHGTPWGTPWALGSAWRRTPHGTPWATPARGGAAGALAPLGCSPSAREGVDRLGQGYAEAAEGALGAHRQGLRYDLGPTAGRVAGAAAGAGVGAGEDSAWRQAVEEAALHMRMANPSMPVSQPTPLPLPIPLPSAPPFSLLDPEQSTLYSTVMTLPYWTTLCLWSIPCAHAPDAVSRPRTSRRLWPRRTHQWRPQAFAPQWRPCLCRPLAPPVRLMAPLPARSLCMHSTLCAAACEEKFCLGVSVCVCVFVRMSIYPGDLALRPCLVCAGLVPNRGGAAGATAEMLPVCRDFVKGRCSREACRFVHPQEGVEVRAYWPISLSLYCPYAQAVTVSTTQYTSLLVLPCVGLLGALEQYNTVQYSALVPLCTLLSPLPSLQVVDNLVTVCRDSKRGKCERPHCRFYHPKAAGAAAIPAAAPAAAEVAADGGPV